MRTVPRTPRPRTPWRGERRRLRPTHTANRTTHRVRGGGQLPARAGGPSRGAARGVPGPQPWRISLHRGRGTPHHREGRERSDPLPHRNEIRQGWSEPRERRPWHPKLGRGNNLQTHLQNRARGPLRPTSGPFPASDSSFFGPSHASDEREGLQVHVAEDRLVEGRFRREFVPRRELPQLLAGLPLTAFATRSLRAADRRNVQDGERDLAGSRRGSDARARASRPASRSRASCCWRSG